jgi:hypothetical protein
MRRFPIPPFPLFCFAVFVLCIPAGYELGAARLRSAKVSSVQESLAPALEQVRADAGRTPITVDTRASLGSATLAAPQPAPSTPPAFMKLSSMRSFSHPAPLKLRPRELVMAGPSSMLVSPARADEPELRTRTHADSLTTNHRHLQ